MANLPILVSSHKCQLTGPKVSLEDNGPHLTLMESVSDSLVRNMHTSSLLEALYSALAVLPLFLVAQRSRYRSCCRVDALLRPCPVPRATAIPRYLLHVLETVLGDTANRLGTARMDVLSWRSCETWLGCRYHLSDSDEDIRRTQKNTGCHFH